MRRRAQPPEGERAQGWVRTLGRGPFFSAGISSRCTLSFLDPWGSTSAILASLKSDKDTKKVCKGPPSPPLLVFARVLLWGIPHPRARRPPFRRFSSSRLDGPSPQEPRQPEFPSWLWDSEPGRTGDSGGDAEQVESCPFVTGDLAAQG